MTIKTYTTPPAGLLSDRVGSSEGLEVIKGESLAQFLTDIKTPCTFERLEILPQFFQYHFNYIDISRAGNLKKALSALSMVLHCKTFESSSNIAHFSIIIPRKNKGIIYFKQGLYDPNFDKARPFSAYLGLSSENKNILLDLEKSPHILLAGASGSGKSVCLNTIINSLLYKATPHDVGLVMIDPKRVEFNFYKGLPHLLTPVINDPLEAIDTLKELCRLMDSRYEAFSKENIKDISETTKYKHIIIIIDELADLMLRSRSSVEDSIIRISQLGRAAGFHLIIATQRPTVKVITGLIKANMTTRIALQTASKRDSINILDYQGAEALTGKGDGILKTPDKVETTRFQTAFIQNDDIIKIVEYWKSQA